MSNELSNSASRVQEFLSKSGKDFDVREFSSSTRTAADAAESVGCEVGQIAKSLIFQDKKTDELVLVIASGSNRVDTKKISKTVGFKLKQAKADLVKEKTGFAIGGIPPVAHSEPLQTILDEDLQQYAEIWAAAGTPHSVFQLTPTSLEELTSGEWLDLRQE
ncbi:YbaK/EbsC family protein [Desulfovibrio sp. JC010]|uniref:YbaK/EbsC family protein n=1 Tax=Desulfovibrio sp. JC010 TaxID=2593641 RepID=UPI0013D36146|nr:YbaK/EbsC family protein [Desulfovibrio sp. JC010]NDV26041.1 YbaK/EbsC family protein [Desulfovibrio sp. JC010]